MRQLSTVLERCILYRTLHTAYELSIAQLVNFLLCRLTTFGWLFLLLFTISIFILNMYVNWSLSAFAYFYVCLLQMQKYTSTYDRNCSSRCCKMSFYCIVAFDGWCWIALNHCNCKWMPFLGRIQVFGTFKFLFADHANVRLRKLTINHRHDHIAHAQVNLIRKTKKAHERNWLWFTHRIYG